MPELAEVEYFRRQWDSGFGRRVIRVATHSGKRVFRGTDVAALETALTGTRLLGSEGHGKQMLFRFSRGASLGIHLGMSGQLGVEAAGISPGKHDHLARPRLRPASGIRQFDCTGRDAAGFSGLANGGTEILMRGKCLGAISILRFAFSLARA